MVIYSCFFMVIGEKFLYLQAPKNSVVACGWSFSSAPATSVSVGSCKSNVTMGACQAALGRTKLGRPGGKKGCYRV